MDNEKSLDHIFMHCPYARYCLNRLLSLFGMEACLPFQVDRWLLKFLRGWEVERKSSRVSKFAARALLWSLWLERNRRAF